MEAGRRTRKKQNEQNLLRYVRVRYGRLPANAPPDALRKQAALLASRRRSNAPVCFRKESESTVPNEEPKHASATPPVGAFEIGGRPKNWLVPVVLLSLREWNSYGYELMGRARMFGFGATNPGTLYRTLRQKEKDGVVESSWETSRGGAGTSDVRHHRLWRGIPGRLGQVFGAIPAEHGRLLRALWEQAATRG